ncbi:MAG TPA: hypothetical protein P5125_07715 [Kiritimatiellia bacterium]|nr:hypothetical protein [Kiritimatiellia bacterium]
MVSLYTVGIAGGVLGILLGFALPVCGSDLALRFRTPRENWTRPGVELTFRTAHTNQAEVVRQLERAQALGFGSVLAAVEGPEEGVWPIVERLADTCHRLGLELGLHDFPFAGDGGKNRARCLVWTEEPSTAFGGTNALNRVVQENGALAVWAVPADRSGAVHPHEMVDLTRAALPTTGVWRVFRFALREVTPPLTDGYAGNSFARHVNRTLSACQSRLPQTYGTTLPWYQFNGPQRDDMVWPADLPERFLRNSGLNLMRFLPVLAGVPVGGEATAQYVRRQLRQSVREAWREGFARHADELVHEAGLEAGIAIDAVPVEPEEVPLSFRRPMFAVSRDADAAGVNRRAAGVARVLRRRFVIGRLPLNDLAETPAATLLPFRWKPEAERLLVEGATRLLLVPSGDLPDEDAAFRSLREGCDTVRRCQVLLQHGEPVADFLVWTEGVPPVLEGYACDYATPALMERATVSQGRIRFESDRTYNALVVPAGVMGREAARRRIGQIAARGVTVWLMEEADGAAGTTAAETMPAGCRRLRPGAPDAPRPDLFWQSEQAGMRLSFLHRRTPEREIYFLVNDTPEAGPVRCTFRDAGAGMPLRWDPVSGETDLVVQGASRTGDGRVTAPLFLGPHDACFIVFERAHAN